MHLRELSQTKQALGGTIELAVVTHASPKESERLFNTLWRQVFMFEKQFSRFLPMSELSAFNRSAGLKTFITPEFRDLLIKARELGISTGGLYNPFILPALQRAGYTQSAALGYEADPQEDHSRKRVVGVESLNIGDEWALIPYGTAIDMGGCGKGYLADRLGETLHNNRVVGYWLSLGGDVATFGSDAEGNNITLNIQNADNLDDVAGWILHCPRQHAAAATSGTFRRKAQASGKWHHIIDPKTLRPAVTDVRLATVCASTALEADVLASCAVILGSKKAPAFLKKHGAKAVLLQCMDDNGVTFEKKFGPSIKRSYAKRAEEVLRNA